MTFENGATKPAVFFSRCKPQGVDALQIALDAKRVFIGYPMHRKSAQYDPRNLKSCVVDPSCDDEQWLAEHAQSDRSRQYNQNRNLVRSITIGSIALIPRPREGVIYCGRVTGNFELVDSPSWYNRYMQLRGGHDGDEYWHAADVAQCWQVDSFRAVPMPRIPAWIRRSLFGRSTYGIIRSQDGTGTDPYSVMSAILDASGFGRREWSLDPEVVEDRLMTDLTPSTFEHLVVSLLQLEHADEVWTQVGGSGDGGLDGIGADLEGHVSGLLQCKWQFWGGDCFEEQTIWKSNNVPIRRYVAALLYPANVVKPTRSDFLDRKKIAQLVIKHHASLPQAMAMRIGVPPMITMGQTTNPLAAEYA